jgi:membrane protease YdiL (CAAX protease family)
MPLMDLLRDRVSLILVGAVAVTLGPLCEELAFRGFLLPLLIRSLSALPGILITALLFASLHGPEYAWSWRHLLLITLAGVAFGWMRYRSGSTATATVMHAAYNLTFFVGMVAQRVPQ